MRLQIHRAGEEQYAEQGRAHRDFVADDLRTDRNEPSKLYLLFEDHPPRITP